MRLVDRNITGPVEEGETGTGWTEGPQARFLRVASARLGKSLRDLKKKSERRQGGGEKDLGCERGKKQRRVTVTSEEGET